VAERGVSHQGDEFDMGNSETRFEVNGMKCNGCLVTATAAIESVAGVINAKVDLAEKSAVVKGTADPRAVIDALAKVGYPATVKIA